MYKIAVLIFDGCWATQVFLAHDLFHIANSIAQEPELFTVSMLSVSSEPITTSSGNTIFSNDTLENHDEYDAIIIPAMEGKFLAEINLKYEDIVQFLIKQLECKKKIICFSTGTYFLARTELLQNVLLTTHWAFVNTLHQLFPLQQLTGQYAYLCHENIYTTSSFKGCVDSLLKIIELQKGKNFSQLCSSYFLVQNTKNNTPLLPIYRKHKNEKITHVQDWLDENYAINIKVSELASLFKYSERTLNRHFRDATNISLLQYQQLIRLEKAKQMLLTTNFSINQISYQIGYENVSFFIQLFNKYFNDTPASWRKNHLL